MYFFPFSWILDIEHVICAKTWKIQIGVHFLLPRFYMSFFLHSDYLRHFCDTPQSPLLHEYLSVGFLGQFLKVLRIFKAVASRLCYVCTGLCWHFHHLSHSSGSSIVYPFIQSWIFSSTRKFSELKSIVCRTDCFDHFPIHSIA